MALQRWVSGAMGLLLGAGAVSFAAPAAACSLPPCGAPVRLAPSPYLPGDQVYFQILTSEDPTDLALRTAEGEPIAASIRDIEGDRVFAPEQPIAEGTALVLQYSTSCFGEPTTLTYDFTTTAPGPLELEPAQLELEESGVKGPGRFDETAFVRVRHVSGDVNGDASALMIHTYTIDGVPAGQGEFGGQLLIEMRVPCRPQVSSLQIDTCGNLNSAPPGVHRFEVSTHIIGAATQPEPVSLQVDVQCPEAEADEPSVDGESPPTEPAPDTGAPFDTPSGHSPIRELEGADRIDEAPAPPLSPEASSCALGAGGAGTGSSGLLVLAAALGIARARRSRRH